jgi:hypothetical protein
MAGIIASLTLREIEIAERAQNESGHLANALRQSPREEKRRWGQGLTAAKQRVLFLPGICEPAARQDRQEQLLDRQTGPVENQRSFPFLFRPSLFHLNPFLPEALMRLVLALAITVHVALAQQNADKPRVFITDSESWEMVGSAAGANGAFASQVQAGARPQTAEIIKTFGERCPDVVTNNRIEKADYAVVLDHEGGKGYLRHRNKVAVFGRISGDSVVSHSTLSLGNSVKDACDGIDADWKVNGAAIQALAAT